jgi:hypothetical protein
MSGFVKIDREIVQSSLWNQAYPTRIAFIALLVQADHHTGIARCAGASGLARLAAITEPEAVEAIRALTAPDADSKSAEAEGRRIEPVAGGFYIINFHAYRERDYRAEKRAEDAERQRQKRKRDAESRDCHVTECDTSSSSSSSDPVVQSSVEEQASSRVVEVVGEEEIAPTTSVATTKPKQVALALPVSSQLDRYVELYLRARALRMHETPEDAARYGTVSAGTRAEIAKYMLELLKRRHPPELIVSLPALTDKIGLLSNPTVLLRTGDHPRKGEDGVTRGATCHAVVIDGAIADKERALDARQIDILRAIGTLDYVKKRGAYSKVGWGEEAK